ncbi:MAG: alpha/beta fold hydrolase [Eubacteriales bacterium]|nr:alpha/beta fold hydrolase [Eubacteriales bacterium]
MGESLRSQLFINSEQVGDFVEVTLPATGDEEECEIARIHYLEAGVGEPLLLIHSVGQSLYTWRNVFAELSDNYRVIAIDLPGHGYSSRPDSFSYTADDIAAVLNSFLDALNVKSAHMIGFSLGAMYMLRFLSLFPRRVANCIAISPGGVTEQMPKLVHRLQTPMVATFARNLYTASNVRAMLTECFADPALVDDHVVRQYYEPVSDGLAREAVMYALRNFDSDAIAEGLMPVEHEVLVLWGKNDRWHPPAGSVYFQSLLRAGRYYLVRNAGHLLQEEAPVKLLEIVYSYIPPAVPSYDVYRYTQHLAEDEES